VLEGLVRNPVEAIAIGMIFTSFFIVENRNLRYSAYAYTAQSTLLVAVFLAVAYWLGEHHFYVWAATATVTKVIIVPLLILWAVRKAMVEVESPPLIGLPFSLLVESLIIALSFYTVLYALHVPSAAERFKLCLAVSFILFFIGVYGMMSRRCAVKQSICLCHMENGVHLMLASLAYTSPITVEIGIVTDAVVAIALMLYLSVVMRQVTGSTDTSKLRMLRW